MPLYGRNDTDEHRSYGKTEMGTCSCARKIASRGTPWRVRNRMNELGVGPHPWVHKRRRETRSGSTQSHRDQSPVHLSKRRRSGENTHFRRFSIDPQFPESRMGLTTKKMPADRPKTGHLP